MAKKGEKVDVSNRKNFPKDTTGMTYKRHVPKSKDKRKQNHAPNIYNTLNLDEAKDLCQIGCTEREVAAYFEVNVNTLRKAIRLEYELSWKEFFNENNGKFKVSLRRMQYRSAEGDFDEEGNKYRAYPSVPMQIWLGKQFLAQTDKAENVIEEKTHVPMFKWGNTEDVEAEDITDQKEIGDGSEED